MSRTVSSSEHERAPWRAEPRGRGTDDFASVARTRGLRARKPGSLSYAALIQIV